MTDPTALEIVEAMEMIAKGGLGNDQKIVDLIKTVAEGAQKSDDLLLQAINELVKSVKSLANTVKLHEDRLSLLESNRK